MEVRLRHAYRDGNWMMYFYEGELPVVDSVVTIPADRPEWIQRAWIQGFRLTADGRVIADLGRHIRSETAQDEPQAPEPETPAADEAENAMSDEENDNDEGTADRGQPAGEDGVRTSEPDRSGSVPARGMGSRSRSEPAEG